MPKSQATLLLQLETAGYLSLNQFVSYLQQYQPHAAVSYPTAVKLVRDGKIKANRIGNQWRILRREVERWVSEGNYDVDFSGPYPKHPGEYR